MIAKVGISVILSISASPPPGGDAKLVMELAAYVQIKFSWED